MEDIIRNIVGLATILGGVFASYHAVKYQIKRLSDRVDIEVKLREQQIAECQADVSSISATINSNLARELAFVNQAMREHREQFERLWQRFDTFNVSISRIDEKLTSHIANQEKICKLNHSNKPNNG